MPRDRLIQSWSSTPSQLRKVTEGRTQVIRLQVKSQAAMLGRVTVHVTCYFILLGNIVMITIIIIIIMIIIIKE